MPSSPAKSLAAVLIVAALSACRQPDPPGPMAAALLAFAEEAARRLGRPPPPNEQASRSLRALLDRARALSPGAGEPDPIARVLLDARTGLQPDPVDDSIERALLPFVLERRRGSCIGLAGVYLALAEPLGVRAHGVIAPGHFLVRRLDGDGARDLELLEGGRVIAADELRRKHAIPASNPLYLRALGREETLAAFRYNLANALREQRRYRDAIAEYASVLKILPDLAEAHQNLGLCHHRLGEHRHAERAYLRALALHPGLRGVRDNLALLHRSARPDPLSARDAEAGVAADVGVQR